MLINIHMLLQLAFNIISNKDQQLEWLMNFIKALTDFSSFIIIKIISLEMATSMSAKFNPDRIKTFLCSYLFTEQMRKVYLRKYYYFDLTALSLSCSQLENS